MRELASGTGWTLGIEENVLVGEFVHPECFKTEVEEINHSFMQHVTDASVTSHVACVEFDERVGDHMLEGAKEAARAASEHGVEKWGIVAPGIKQLAIKNNVDIENLEVFTTEDRVEAMDWARE